MNKQLKLVLERIYKGDTYTIGRLYINGERFCDTLEDKDRGLIKEMPLKLLNHLKVKHETAIPTGTYRVIVNRSPKFKRDLPRLLNVPAFDGILIHRGNTAVDTSGCILVGENKVKGKVLNSTPYEIKLTTLIQEADEATIEIK